MTRRSIVLCALVLTTGCANLSREAAVGITAVLTAGGTYLATDYVQGRMRCGDLEGFTSRSVSAGWETPGIRSALSAHFRISEQALAATTHSADITLSNAISVACYLTEKYPQSDTIQALTLRMIEAASAPRLVIEEAARQVAPGAAVPRTEERLQAEFRRFRARLESFADSVQQATRANPTQALEESVEASTSQQSIIQFYLRVILDDSPRSVATHHAVQTLLAEVVDLRREFSIERSARERTEQRLGSLEATTLSGLGGLAALQFLAPVDTTSIAFETGRYIPDDSAVARLVDWTQQFRDPRYSFSLTGGADPRGSPDLNQALSEARARYVRNVLIERVGIPPLRIATTGIGVGTFSDSGPLDDPSRRRVHVIVHGTAVEDP